MRLLLECEDGTVRELKEATKIDGNKDRLLVVFVDEHIRPLEIDEMEKNISMKTGRSVIVLDAKFKPPILIS